MGEAQTLSRQARAAQTRRQRQQPEQPAQAQQPEQGQRRIIRRRGRPLPHLQQWREHAAYSQKELAALSGVSRPTLVRAEGDPARAVVSYASIRKLAAALGITVQQLDRAPTDGDAVTNVTPEALADMTTTRRASRASGREGRE